LIHSKKNWYINDNHFFLNKSGKKLSARSIRYIVKKYVKRANINKNITPHSIRHSFATHLLQEGAGIREIQELLGHENISTTQIYSHLNIKKLKKDYKKFHPRA
jgi:site-specific recombinase XerD